MNEIKVNAPKDILMDVINKRLAVLGEANVFTDVVTMPKEPTHTVLRAGSDWVSVHFTELDKTSRFTISAYLEGRHLIWYAQQVGPA